MKSIVSTPQAPPPFGPYSQAVRVGDTVHVSGQVGADLQRMALAEGTRAQVEQAVDHVETILAAAGGGLADVVSLRVHLASVDDFDVLNEVLAERLAAPYPARTTTVPGLPDGVLVEIDAVAVIGWADGAG